MCFLIASGFALGLVWVVSMRFWRAGAHRGGGDFHEQEEFIHA